MQHDNEIFDVLIIVDNPSLEVLPSTYNKSWVFGIIIFDKNLGSSKNWRIYFIGYLS